MKEVLRVGLPNRSDSRHSHLQLLKFLDGLRLEEVDLAEFRLEDILSASEDLFVRVELVAEAGLQFGVDEVDEFAKAQHRPLYHRCDDLQDEHLQ